MDKFENYGQFRLQGDVNGGTEFTTYNTDNDFIYPSTSKGVTNGKLVIDSSSTFHVYQKYGDPTTGNFNNGNGAIVQIGGHLDAYNLDNYGTIETYYDGVTVLYPSIYIVNGLNRSNANITMAGGSMDAGLRASNLTNDGNITVIKATSVNFWDFSWEQPSNKGLINNGTLKTIGSLTGQILNNNSVDATGILGLQITNKANSKFNYLAVAPLTFGPLQQGEGSLYLSNDYNATTTINSSYDHGSTPSVDSTLNIKSLDNTGDLILGVNAAAFLSTTVVQGGKVLPLVNQKITSEESTQTGNISISKSATLAIVNQELWPDNRKTIFTNNGIITNKGQIINNATIDNSKGQIIGKVDNEGGGTVIGPKLTGNGIIIGNYENIGIFAPGNSLGGHLIDGNLTNSVGSVKEIELGGTSDAGRSRENTEHDFIDVTGDLIINGGSLDVSLVNDFKLQSGQEFIIAKVDGELIGKYDDLDEGATVGHFDSIYGNKIGLNITYTAGNGNDIALYTDPLTHPEMILNNVW